MIEIGPEVGWETRSGWHQTADILGSPAWKWQPTPAFSPGKSHGTEETDGPSSWGHTQRDRHDQAYMALQPGAHGQNLEAEVYIISVDCVQVTDLKT